jgi:hypothetical protein
MYSALNCHNEHNALLITFMCLQTKQNKTNPMFIMAVHSVLNEFLEILLTRILQIALFIYRTNEMQF